MLNYGTVQQATFLARHKRFTATVLLQGEEQTVHVKNTGRCKELLIPGAKVYLAPATGPARKTRFDLVSVDKGGMLVNIDSQAPNQVAATWLSLQYPGARIQREVTLGDSRLDFHLTGPQGFSLYVEVKGCTLEVDGRAMFPDAPTQRGGKHLRCLQAAVQAGHQAMVLFIIQMRPVTGFSPNDAMDPAFGAALRQAQRAGVQVHALDCLVGPGSLAVHQPVPLHL